MARMNDNKGVAKLISNITNSNAETYYDDSRITVYWFGATKEQVKHLQANICKYIGDHMLMDSFKKVTIFN